MLARTGLSDQIRRREAVISSAYLVCTAILHTKAFPSIVMRKEARHHESRMIVNDTLLSCLWAVNLTVPRTVKSRIRCAICKE